MEEIHFRRGVLQLEVHVLLQAILQMREISYLRIQLLLLVREQPLQRLPNTGLPGLQHQLYRRELLPDHLQRQPELLLQYRLVMMGYLDILLQLIHLPLGLILEHQILPPDNTHRVLDGEHLVVLVLLGVLVHALHAQQLLLTLAEEDQVLGVLLADRGVVFFSVTVPGGPVGLVVSLVALVLLVLVADVGGSGLLPGEVVDSLGVGHLFEILVLGVGALTIIICDRGLVEF